MTTPKLFVSYSWSNPAHEQRVLDLASELVEAGIDVILDKWNLHEGQDAVAFMEQMVTNPEITKVAIISDRVYAEKADGRRGGVGTETQIISREVYENQDQNKFVVVAVERDDEGKVYVPTYAKSRIHIDLSVEETYADHFEKLLRWIYNKPLHVRPPLGKTPSFLVEDPQILLGNSAAFRRCQDAIRNNKPSAVGAFDDYTVVLIENLEKLRISGGQAEFDELVVKSIEDFLPYRNEVIQILVTVYQYSTGIELSQKVHRLFEGLIRYLGRSTTSRYDWDNDNYRFIVHELFLYALAIMLKHERFTDAQIMLEQNYFVGDNLEYRRQSMVGYPVFREYMKSLVHRNERLNLRRLSLRADFLKQRASGTGLDFRYLMQADFLAFMRAELKYGEYDRWWPETLLYANRREHTFEIFARAESKSYFNRIKGVLGIEDISEIDQLFDQYRKGERKVPRWEFDSFEPVKLIGREELMTRP